MNRIISSIFSIIIAFSALFIITPSVSAASLTPAAGKVITESSALNVRFSASASSDVVSSLKKGAWVMLISKSGSWWKVKYSSQNYGYCKSSFIKARKSSYTAYISDDVKALNVRKGAGIAYKIKTKLPAGSRVSVLSQSGKWSRILYNGTKKGYVSSKYLSKKSPQLKPVMLNVPELYQNDSRWKNVRIGAQGDTIGSSGCTTTCIAMVESFIAGRIITPADMAKTLSYSRSGSLYWSDGYYTELADADFLDRIYQILSSGKPVIFGAKKNSGGQHWVVVTGFDKSGLNEAAFSINDPGSASRKTLADFMETYPDAYKIAWKN